MAVRLTHGSWWVDFGFKGKRYRKRSPLNTREGAKEYETRLRHQLLTGQVIIDEPKVKQVITFKEFAERWFNSYVVANNKPSEVENKQGILKNHLLVFFGELPIDAIKREMIEEYKAAKLQSGLSPKTVNNHLAILAKALNSAVDWEVVAPNSVPKIQKLKYYSKRIDYLLPLEAATLLADKGEQPWSLMIHVALRTGLRFGELIGLKWEAIDLEKNILTVQESVVRGIVGTPKSGKVRHIPLADDLREALLKHQQAKGYLFTVAGFKHISHRMAANALQHIQKRTGLRKLNWHLFRHTFASGLAANGVPIPVIQRLMGHAGIEMTMRYAHLAPDAYATSVNIFKQKEDEAKEKEGTST